MSLPLPGTHTTASSLAVYLKKSESIKTNSLEQIPHHGYILKLASNLIILILKSKNNKSEKSENLPTFAILLCRHHGPLIRAFVEIIQYLHELIHTLGESSKQNKLILLVTLTLTGL